MADPQNPLAPALLQAIEATRDARLECDGYRLVARAAVNHVHDLQIELARVKAAYHRLIEEYRAHRERERGKAA